MPDLPRFDNPALDTQLERYYAELEALTDSALSGDVDERDFIEEMERIVAAAILLMFLLGGGSMIVPGAQRVIDARLREQRRSIRKLADDIYGGRYSAISGAAAQKAARQTAEEGQEKLRNRLVLWTGAAAALYREGQVHSPTRVGEGRERVETRLVWRLGPTEHCRTCQSLSGVVLTTSEWRRVGIAPQVIGDGKECGGWRCQCRWEEVEAESAGIENVAVA